MSGSETGNGKDRSFERAQLRRRLSELTPKDRLEALISASDAKELVQSLPAEDLYGAIADVGLADSAEIVQLASAEQFRTFIDLGAWAKDRIDVHRAITWLRAARGDEQSEFLAKVHGLDLELLELLLRAATAIHDRDQDPDFHPEGLSVETPDGKYLVELLVEGAELSAMRALVSELIAEDPFQASRLFEAIRWELPSDVEETAYQFRQARLGDLGFPQLEQAAAIFTFVEPGPGASPASAEARAITGPLRDYLGAAFRGADAEESERLEEQFRYLANTALVAEAAEPGDPVAGRRVAEMVRDYLALGFEHLCGSDPAHAPAVARESGLRRVFQTGFSLTLKLKFRVDRLARHPLARLDDDYLIFPPEAAILSALGRKRPMRALQVEGAEPVPFRSAAELRQADAAITRAEQQVSFLGALLGGTPATAREVLERFGAPLRQLGVERLFAAIAANGLLDSNPMAAPVDPARLAELLEKLIDRGSSSPSPRPSAVEQVNAVLLARVPTEARVELRRQVEKTMSALAADLGPAYLRDRSVEPQALVNLPLRGASGL
jgi:hypothetical protein